MDESLTSLLDPLEQKQLAACIKLARAAASALAHVILLPGDAPIVRSGIRSGISSEVEIATDGSGTYDIWAHSEPIKFGLSLDDAVRCLKGEKSNG